MRTMKDAIEYRSTEERDHQRSKLAEGLALGIFIR
jgi:hypothetical protein